jgi:KDO2-lipid IV(A) lauroyltransferase
MNREYLQYRSADVLSSFVPRRFAYMVGRCISDGFYRRDPSGRAAVQNNIRHILEYQGVRPSEDVLDAMARQTFRSFGKYIVDFFRYRRMTPGIVGSLVTIEHPDYLDELKARKTGFIVASAHLGNWEIAGSVLATMGFRMNAVVLPNHDAGVERLFTNRRKQRGFNLIPLSEAVDGALRAIARKECVALLTDRDYSQRDDQTIFLGAPARLPLGVATIAVRTGTPIFQGFLVREPDDTFRFKLYRPIFPSRHDSVQDVHAVLCANLASAICESPTQWFMFKNFWQVKPREAETP